MTRTIATPAPGIFERSRAAAGRAGFPAFDHVASTGSTNTDLAMQARGGSRGPAVLVTDHQHAGKGRLDREWVDDGVSQLMVSFRIPAAGRDAGWVGAAVAVAARAALADHGLEVVIKWPNDLGVSRPDGSFAKLAGYLSEFVDGDDPVVVVGMGLNVASSPFPEATCVHELGADVDRDTILAASIEALDPLLDDPAAVRGALVTHSATIGRRVRVERSTSTLVGAAVGVDASGRLLVDDGDTVHAVAVGDVIHLRPAAG